jgi:anti-sigma factor RsiW
VITCKRFVAGLSDYLDDALDAAMRARFDRHAAECPRCRIVSTTTRQTVELYRTFPPGEVSLALETRLMAAIRTRTQVRQQKPFS